MQPRHCQTPFNQTIAQQRSISMAWEYSDIIIIIIYILSALHNQPPTTTTSSSSSSSQLQQHEKYL